VVRLVIPDSGIQAQRRASGRYTGAGHASERTISLTTQGMLNYRHSAFSVVSIVASNSPHAYRAKGCIGLRLLFSVCPIVGALS
jgi:hypothetical protein